jgi:hypothetical protein
MSLSDAISSSSLMLSIPLLKIGADSNNSVTNLPFIRRGIV